MSNSYFYSEKREREFSFMCIRNNDYTCCCGSKYFDISMLMLIVAALQVQKTILNYFFGGASPGVKTKLSLEQEASVTSLFPGVRNC